MISQTSNTQQLPSQDMGSLRWSQDQEERTVKGVSAIQYRNLGKKEKIKSGDPDSNNVPSSEKSTNKIVENVIYGLMVVMGAFITFFGFRLFRVLMLILGTMLVYQITLFVIVETRMFVASSATLQILIFSFSILMGLFISFSAYMIEKINFLILGFAAGSQISMLFGCFFVDFDSNQQFYLFWGILLLSSALVSFFAYWKIDHTAILMGSLIGAITVSINVGIITNKFPSIQMRKHLSNHRFTDFYHVLIMVSVLFTLGLCSQYFLRYRLIRTIEKQELDDSIHEEVEIVDK